MDDQDRLLERRHWRDGKLHGNHETFHLNGRLEVRQAFVAGRLHGVSETYDASGVLRQRSRFEDGALHGEVTTYDASGQITQTAQYQRGELHGLMTIFAVFETPQQDATTAPTAAAPPQTPRRLASMTYHEGLLEGPLVTFDGLERPTFEVSYRGGLRQGLASWFQGEALVRQGTYVDDRLQGELIDFHPNGRPRERVPYENDQAHGIAVRYYKNGKVKEKLRFHHGEQVGDSLQYDASGQRFSTPRRGRS